MEVRSWVPVEFYLISQVLSGYIYISSESRLLDMLNGAGPRAGDVGSDYIEFMNTLGSGNEERRDARYVRKSAVVLAAIAEANLARGAGAMESPKSFPYAEKSQVKVSVVTPEYVLDGTMHCTPGRSVRDTLDEHSLFLPLTEVTISQQGRFYGDRPFVAARKEEIILLTEE
jgi:hypothetical protein